MGIQLKPGEAKPNINWYAEYAEAKVQIKKFYVSPDMVKKQINLSKTSASHGPDTIPMEAISMTSLFAHKVAQPTKWRFLPKNLSQLFIFVIGLAFAWV